MRHAKIKKLLTEYVDGGLRPDRARMVEDHLATCPSCREIKDELEFAVRACGELPEAEMSLEVETSIREMIREEASGAKRRSRSFSLLSRPAIIAAGAGVASAIIAVVLVVSLTGGGGQITQRDTEELTEKGTAAEAPIPAESEKATSREDLKTSIVELMKRAGEAAGISPVVTQSDTDYNQSSIQELAEGMPIHQEVATEFTMTDIFNKGSEFLNIILDELTSGGAQPSTLESMINFITKEEQMSLPVYVEKAKFQGKNAWIIGLAAPSRSGDTTNLNRLEVWVLDPDSFAQDPNSSILFFGEHRILEQ